MEKLRVGMRSNNNLSHLLKDIPTCGDMLEIGCFAGESTLMFWQSGKFKRIFAVDPWSQKFRDRNNKEKPYNKMYDDMEWAERSFDQRMKGCNVVKLKGTISEFLHVIPPLDFVYIDGNHSYDFVKNDIIQAKKLIRKCGIIAGHDYLLPDVKKAVDEFFQVKVYPDQSWRAYGDI